MKRLFITALLLCMLATLAACGSESAPTQVSDRNVSILTPYLSSVTTNQMVEEMKKGLEANNVTVTVVDTKGDFSQLASRIEDTVSAKADAIVLVSMDPGQVTGALQAAFDAGVPVFGCDSGFVDGMQLNATSDNYAMGELITKYLFDDLMGGEGTVIALTHRPHPGVLKRCEAFDALLKDYPDIKLITEQHVNVPGPIENSRQIMENLLLANAGEDSITAVWCAWDEPAIGAAQALDAAGRTNVIVTGVDGNSQALEMINEGGNLKATVSQNFEGMAGIVVEELMKLFNNEEVKTGDQYAPATLIVKE